MRRCIFPGPRQLLRMVKRPRAGRKSVGTGESIKRGPRFPMDGALKIVGTILTKLLSECLSTAAGVPIRTAQSGQRTAASHSPPPPAYCMSQSVTREHHRERRLELCKRVSTGTSTAQVCVYGMIICACQNPRSTHVDGIKCGCFVPGKRALCLALMYVQDCSLTHESSM